MAEFKQKNLEDIRRESLPGFESSGGRTILREGEFQSPNFRTNQTGWKVDSEGNAEFQSVKIRLSKGVFGGDGSDGALDITSGTTTIDLESADIVTKNFTSISITGDGKLVFSNPASTGTFIILKSQGDVILTSSSDPNIDCIGAGAAGGAGATNGNGARGTTAVPVLDVANHYGEGGDTDGGGTGGTLLDNGVFYTVSDSKFRAFGQFVTVGSGGGGGRGAGGGTGGDGGRGGGSLVIECAGDLDCTGNIDVEGQAGTDGSASGSGGGGGGGSSGTCLVYFNTKTAVSGTISDAGGAGGQKDGGATGGGGGGGGIGGAGGLAQSTGNAFGGGGAGGAGAGGGAGEGGAASTSADHYIQI